MIPEYKLITTVPTLQYGYMSVDKWIAMFPHLSQDDFNNPRLFTSNLESMVEPKKKEQEWEIQSFINATNDVVLTRFPDGLYRWKQQHSGDTSEALLAMPHMKIYSVKRLSDGQTFSVGDEWNGGYTLTAFKIEDGVILYEMNNNGYFYDARTLVPPTQKQQPPQEEQKDNDVFEWTDKDIVDFCNYVAKPRVRWGTGIMEEEIKKFKASKSTLAKFPETKSFNSIDEAPDMAKPLYDFLNKEQQIDCLPKCCICGGDTVLIRGKYPSTPKRNVCAQCNTERLEQIQEISSPDYGRTCQNS